MSASHSPAQGCGLGEGRETNTLLYIILCIILLYYSKCIEQQRVMWLKEQNLMVHIGVKRKGSDGESGLFCQLKLVQITSSFFLMTDSMVLLVFMQQEVYTLTKPPSAGLVLNTFSCRNLTVQQANYFFGMWPFHYRKRKLELCYHCYTMTCWQTVSETQLGLVYWSVGVEPHHSVNWLFTCR